MRLRVLLRDVLHGITWNVHFLSCLIGRPEVLLPEFSGSKCEGGPSFATNLQAIAKVALGLAMAAFLFLIAIVFSEDRHLAVDGRLIVENVTTESNLTVAMTSFVVDNIYVNDVDDVMDISKSMKLGGIPLLVVVMKQV